MILESILGVGTGLIGNIVSSFTNLKMQKLKNSHEIAKIKAESEAMRAEAEANIRITETEVRGELERLDSAIYNETVKQNAKPSLSNRILEKLFDSPWTIPFAVLLSTLLGLVDFLKGLIRPGLTIYLVILTSAITYQAMNIVSAKEELLTTTEAMDLFHKVVSIVIYLTVSVVTWWFGDRRTAKFLQRLSDGNHKK